MNPMSITKSIPICTIVLWMTFFFVQATVLEATPSHKPEDKPARYFMTVSDSAKFVWFRTAKVGTRTILKILNDNKTQLSAYNIQAPYDPEKYKDYFKFAFVRNPWDRIVSCYCNKVLTKSHPPFGQCFDKGFDYFVDFINKQNVAKGDNHIKLQTKLLPYYKVDFIGHFETFSEDLQHVLKTIGLKNVEIPKKNASEHAHYSKYYTERTKNIIAKKYKADIEAFGYRFETALYNSPLSQ